MALALDATGSSGIPTGIPIAYPWQPDYAVQSSIPVAYPPGFAVGLPVSDLKTPRFCKNCRGSFMINENHSAACSHHKGKFRPAGTTIASGVKVGWTCCKDRNKDALGCTLSAHTEDASINSVLCRFPEASPEEIEQMLLQQKALESPTVPSEEQPKKVASQEWADGHLRHEVKSTDTLRGISLKYNVTVSQLRKANGIIGDDVFAHRELVIPQSDAPINHNLSLNLEPAEKAAPSALSANLDVTHFVSKAGCTPKVAKTYLEMHDFDFQEALEQYLADAEWERTSRIKFKDCVQIGKK